DREGLGPRGGAELAVLVTHLGVGQPLLAAGVGEGEAVLVADPLLVDLRLVAGESAHDLAPTVVDADRSTAGVVLGDARRRHEVEGTGTEPVLGRGERAHRADLDGVAGE